MIRWLYHFSTAFALMILDSKVWPPLPHHHRRLLRQHYRLSPHFPQPGWAGGQALLYLSPTTKIKNQPIYLVIQRHISVTHESH